MRINVLFYSFYFVGFNKDLFVFVFSQVQFFLFLYSNILLYKPDVNCLGFTV